MLTSGFLAAWLFAFTRLLGWAWVDPLLSRLPWSLRFFMAGALAWLPASQLATPQIDPLSISGLGGLIVSFLTGAAMGFAVRVLVAVAESAFAYLGLAANLGLSQTQSEQPGSLDEVMQALGWWLALLAFFSANAHLLVWQAVLASFSALPADALWTAGSALEMSKMGAMLLLSAAQLALPVLVLVMLAQLSIAMLSRLLSGVEAFSVGMTLGVVALLGGLAMATPLMIAALMSRFADLPRLLPQF